MRAPESQKERFLTDEINKKGQAILESGEAWRDGILTFTTYGDLTEREQEFIDALLTEWRQRIMHGR
jgi:hypothetical protein